MGEIHQKVNLDVSGSVAGLEKLAALTAQLDSSLSALGTSQKAAMQAAEKATRDYNKELADGTKIYQKIHNSQVAFKEEGKRLKVLLEQLTKSQKDFIAAGRYEELQQNIAGVKARIKELGGSLDDVGKQQRKVTTEGGSMFNQLGGAIAGAFAVGAVVEWGRQFVGAMFSATAQSQKFAAVLSNSLGSDSAAQRAMLMIQDFAEKTPFSVEELTDSHVKLASRGIRPTVQQLANMSDVSSATGKDLGQLTEAINDISNTERWTEIGIKVASAGNKMTGTFRGLTVEVDKTEAGALKMIEAFGQMQGVMGTTEDVADTLNGGLSNTIDTLDRFFLTIGTQNTTVMGGFIGFLGSALEKLIEISSTTDQLAQRKAAPKVSDFAAELEPELKRVAEQAKASGEDVAAALEAQTAALQKDLEARVTIAKKAVDDIWHVTAFNKNEVVDLKAEKEKLEGQLAALADTKRFILEDLDKKEKASETERAKLATAAAKKAEEDRKKALAELYKELENLEKQAAAAKLNMFDKNSEAYLRAVRISEQKQIAELENSIRERQRLAGKSPELSLEQQKQLQILTQAVDKRYFDALYKLKESQQDTILELQKDSDGKELEQLERKYDQRIRAAREAGQEEVAIALELAKKREAAALGKKQMFGRLDTQENIGIESIKAQLPEGLDNSVTIERARQQAILDVQIEFAKKRLELLADDMTDEGILRKLQLKNTITDLENQNEQLSKDSKKFNLQTLLGLDDDQIQAVSNAANVALGNLQEFLAASVELRQREVENLTRAIDEKGEELDREIELNKQGFASNVETKQQEYNELKEQREKAMRDQQQAQRTQILLDSALQASNLITASTQVYSSLAAIPFVGIPLAIGIIATMFGSFFAAKGKALQAAKAPSFEKGGGFQLSGASHKQGGIELVDSRSGNKLAEYEGNEYLFAINKRSTAKHLDLLEAINNDNPRAISQYVLDDLLMNTGVVPHPELPKKLQTLQAGVMAASVGKNDPYLQEMAQQLKELKGMHYHLKDMNQREKSTPDVFETENHRIEKRGTHTRYIRKL